MEGKTLTKLCEMVKRECKITWNDEITEQEIKEKVESAVISMTHRLGMKAMEPEVFLTPGLTQTLFKKYCTYDWNNMLEEFEHNYRSEILAERHRYEVENVKKASEKVQ